MTPVQTMKHSSEEEQRLAALQVLEDQLMIRVEDLWMKTTKAWQSISTPEPVHKGSKQEAAEQVDQHQTFDRE